MAHLYCNGGNRFNFVSIRNNIQNNFGGGYNYGCSMPSFGGIFSNWGTGIYTGYACNGGWSWSAFAGNTFGSLVGNVLGMLWGGNNGLYAGISNTSGSTQGQRTTGNNGYDTDYEKINNLADEMEKNQTLNDAKQTCSLNNDCDKKILQVTLYNYRKDIKKLRDSLDNKMDEENKRQLNNLEAQIENLDKKFKIDSTKAPELGASNDTQTKTGELQSDNGTKVNNDSLDNKLPKNGAEQVKDKRSLTVPTSITWNPYDSSMIPRDWELPKGYTAPKAEDINYDRIIKVEDTSRRTSDIHVSKCTVSKSNNTNDFPEILEITSNNGKKWYYHYETTINGCPVYITPNTDTNKNVYVLCIQNGEYKLMQFESFSGYTKGDHQNNK